MDGDAGIGVHAVRGMGSIRKVTPETVLGTECRGDIDSPRNQRVDQVGLPAIGCGDLGGVVADDANTFAFQQGQVGIEAGISGYDLSA